MSESETGGSSNPLDKVVESFGQDFKAQQEAAARAASDQLNAAAEAAAESPAAAEPAAEAPAAADVPSAPQTYVVQAGDSLSSISAKVYGDAKHWDTIFEHNKDKISDPNVIQPGQELTIP